MYTISKDTINNIIISKPLVYIEYILKNIKFK